MSLFMTYTGMSKRRAAFVVWMAGLLLWASGCQKAKPIEPAPPGKPGQIYFVMGMADIFSTGLRNMASELREDGYDAQWVSQTAWMDLQSKLLAAHRDGKLNGPLILVGHSLGARHTVDIATTLQRDGVIVDMLVLLDAFLPPEVPGNVKQCVDVHKSTPVLAPEGPRIRAADPSYTLVQSYDIRKGEVEGVSDSALMMHVNFTDFEPLQHWVTAKILQRLERP